MKTQIFGTFGPACEKKDILKQMIEAGMTGMRLNLSHTALTESENYISNYQLAAKEAGVETQILIDMQGPELRVGEFEESLEINAGQTICCCDSQSYPAESGEMNIVPVPIEVVHAAAAGDKVLLDDGKLLLEIYEVNPTYFLAHVVRGGILQKHKSIKIMDKVISMPPLTPHDIENIKVAKEYGVTALMQPFVVNGEDLRSVKSCLKEHGAEGVQVYAKIENRIGVDNIEQILPEADVIIIARGDLGNDMPLWELPRIQKQLEKACQKAGKPYIVVTQMLASMEQNPIPTRAEVSDIFHAVYHGAWGVMLTGETAVGKYPIEAVYYLGNTVADAEKTLY